MTDTPRPPVLFIAHRVPYPPDKGDRIRAFHLLKQLARHASVSLACLADQPVRPEFLAALRCYCARVEVVPVGRWTRWVRALGALAAGRTVSEGAFSSPSLRAVLRQWASETRFSAAVVSASSLVPYLQLHELRDVPAVVDLVDVDSEKWLEYAAASRGPSAWLYRVEGQRLRRLERALPTWARAVTVVSENEAELYRRFAEPGTVAAVTNGVDLNYFRPDFPPGASPGPGPSCVFVGQLDYRPNVDAACWFCEHVWPALRQRFPGAAFRLVGREPAPAVRALAAVPGVEVVGAVPDVRPYVAAATAVVVPLRIARGVQNKLLEALAMGKAVAASPQALAGVPVRPGEEVLAASSPAEWVEAVARLFNDLDLRQELGRAGRRYVEERHHWERCLEPFAALAGLTRGRPVTPGEGRGVEVLP